MTLNPCPASFPTPATPVCLPYFHNTFSARLEIYFGQVLYRSRPYLCTREARYSKSRLFRPMHTPTPRNRFPSHKHMRSRSPSMLRDCPLRRVFPYDSLWYILPFRPHHSSVSAPPSNSDVFSVRRGYFCGMCIPVPRIYPISFPTALDSLCHIPHRFFRSFLS